LLCKIETYATLITFDATTLAFIWSKSLVIHLPRETTVKSTGNEFLKNTGDGPVPRMRPDVEIHVFFTADLVHREQKKENGEGQREEGDAGNETASNGARTVRIMRAE